MIATKQLHYTTIIRSCNNKKTYTQLGTQAAFQVTGPSQSWLT